MFQSLVPGFLRAVPAAGWQPGLRKRTKRPPDAPLSSKALDMRAPTPDISIQVEARRQAHRHFRQLPHANGIAAYLGSGFLRPTDMMNDKPLRCKPLAGFVVRAL